MSQIGFVILTHMKPHQIKRLVLRLNSMFGDPPIVIHHDFGKCPLPDDFLPGNVEFVRPYLVTGWGRYTIVEATVLGLSQMYGQPDPPEWCVILSGACYPVKPAEQILANLNTGGFDAHINGRKVDLSSPDQEWHRERHSRYRVKRLDFPIPSLSRQLRPKIRVLSLPNIIGKHLMPFSGSFHCYGGAHWFTASRRAAEYIISFQQTPKGQELVRHYQDLKYYRPERFPEESYFQTVLYNAPDFKLNFSNWLYLDWSDPVTRPKWLTLSDLPAIQASHANFARKINSDADSDLLDALDRIIDSGKPRS